MPLSLGPLSVGGMPLSLEPPSVGGLLSAEPLSPGGGMWLSLDPASVGIVPLSFAGTCPESVPPESAAEESPDPLPQPAAITRRGVIAMPSHIARFRRFMGDPPTVGGQ